MAHANCQQLLASLWFEGLPGFRRKHVMSQLMLAVAICVSFPFLSLLYIILPCSSCVYHFLSLLYIILPGSSWVYHFLSLLCIILPCSSWVCHFISHLYIILPCSSWVCHFMRRPFIKFLCHASSYLSFVCEYLYFLGSLITVINVQKIITFVDSVSVKEHTRMTT